MLITEARSFKLNLETTASVQAANRLGYDKP